MVGAITPFNFPLILSATKIAPALAAGNTIVHKPRRDTPLSALRLAELLAEAGVPDGVYNLVTGDGAGAAWRSPRHPGVDKIAFTGSTGGRPARSPRWPRETLKQVTVELGGKGANIIFADADLEAAVEHGHLGASSSTPASSACPGSRLLVERPVYESGHRARWRGALPHVPVGDPMAEGTVIGPMAGPAHLAKVRSYLAGPRRPGCGVHDGGDPPGPAGFYVSPAVLADVTRPPRSSRRRSSGRW